MLLLQTSQVTVNIIHGNFITLMLLGKLQKTSGRHCLDCGLPASGTVVSTYLLHLEVCIMLRGIDFV